MPSSDPVTVVDLNKELQNAKFEKAKLEKEVIPGLEQKARDTHWFQVFERSNIQQQLSDEKHSLDTLRAVIKDYQMKIKESQEKEAFENLPLHCKMYAWRAEIARDSVVTAVGNFVITCVFLAAGYSLKKAAAFGWLGGMAANKIRPNRNKDQ